MNEQNKNKELTLQDLLELLWQQKILIGAITLLVLLIGGFTLWTYTPIYQVDALVQIEEKESGLSGVFGEAGAMFEVSSPAEAEIEIIKSRMVLGKTVDQMNLTLEARPQYMPVIGEALARSKGTPVLQLSVLNIPHAIQQEPFGPLVLKVNGPKDMELLTAESKAIGTFQLGKDAGSRYSLRLNAAELNALGLPITSADTSGLTIEIESMRVSEYPQDFVLSIKNRYKVINSVRGNLSAHEKGKQSGMLSLSYQSNNPQQAAEILNSIVTNYVRQNIERKSEEAAKTLSFLQTQLPELKAQALQAENALNEFRTRTGTIDLGQEATLTLSQSVEIETQIIALRQKEKELLRLYKSNHPALQTIQEQIRQLQGQQFQLEKEEKKLPGNQQEFLQLSRDVQVANELYTTMLNNAQQLQVMKAGEIGNVRVVDHAIASYKPVKPRKSTHMALSLLLGLFVGSALALIRRLWNRGVEDPALIESELGLSVYATVPHAKEQENLAEKISKRNKEEQILAFSHGGSLAVESLRSLRTALHFSMMDSPNKVILIAGPAPSIGKSFISANFAATLAQSDKNILLVDADMRRGHIHQYFGKHRDKGLSELLSGQAKFSDCLQASSESNLSFISTGTIPPNPAELLLSARFTAFLEEAEQLFDYVLIDAPPVLAVTDASIIARHAGTTLMLLKSGRHPMGEILTCKQRLEQAGANLKGIVFNDVDVSSGGNGYGKYVYQYGYGDKK